MRKYAKQHGIIFITSIVMLAVMLIIGTTFMGMSVQQFNDARRDLGALHAIAAADAGWNYILYQGQQDNANITIYDGSTIGDLRLLAPNGEIAPNEFRALESVDSDKFAAWVTTVPGHANTYQIISRGIFRDQTKHAYIRTVRALLHAPITEGDPGSGGETDPPPPPVDPNAPPPLPPHPFVFNFAIFSDTGLDIKSQTIINGMIGSNGDIGIKNKALVTSDAYIAKGHLVNRKGTLRGNVIPVDPMVFPTINMHYYENYATKYGGTVINGTLNLPANIPGGGNTFTFHASPGNVIFVKGDINITNNVRFEGIGTIVATGTINIASHVTSTLGTDASLVMISGRDMNITAQVNIEAALLVLGNYKQTSHVDLTGAVVAKDTSFTTAHATITYKRPSVEAPIIPPVVVDDDDDDDGDGDGGDGGDDGGITQKGWTRISWEIL